MNKFIVLKIILFLITIPVFANGPSPGFIHTWAPISVKESPYNAKGDGSTDDSAAILAAANAACSQAVNLYFPPGNYVFSTPLTFTGSSSGGFGTYIGWIGPGNELAAAKLHYTGSSSLDAITFNGIFKVHMQDIGIQGTAKDLIFENNAVGGFGPFGHEFDRVIFNGGVTSCFQIGGTIDLGQFRFMDCDFYAASGGICFFINNNQNALNEQFYNCSFWGQLQGINGLYINGGSFTANRCQFSEFTNSDIYLGVHEACACDGCFTQQSYQFVNAGFNPDVSRPLSLRDCQIYSYPWSYWKQNGGSQPTNDASQWICIVWPTLSQLNLDNVIMQDPYFGSNAGGSAPQTSSYPLVRVLDWVPGQKANINDFGSISFTSTSNFIKDFCVNNSLTPYTMGREYLKMRTTSSASATVYLSEYSGANQEVTMTGNVDFLANTTDAEAGDRMSLTMTQDASGGRTPTFQNITFPQGTPVVPSSTPSARSILNMQFNGTSWDTLSSSLNNK